MKRILNEQHGAGPPLVVLYCGEETLSKEIADRLLEAGVILSRLQTFEIPSDFQVGNLYDAPAPEKSERVRHALERLHGAHRLVEIVFQAEGGLGFRAVQAKRAGLAFADVALAVELASCSAWVREQQERWPGGFDEVELDYLERFAFENADRRICPAPKILHFVQTLGWAVGSPDAGSEKSGCLPREPKVTIGIAHYNLGRYLPDTLASLAAQTYANLEVLVVDDGSTDPESKQVFDRMRQRYPNYRFLTQENAGIGATRNRCLALAGGAYFIPVDADNLARPDMVERFVAAIERNPGLAAMTCYFLAFADAAGGWPEHCLHAYRPTGGPHTLASIRNIYGDANAIFQTEALRAIQGYETDRGTSCEDWELFVKLVHSGREIGVVPAHLFYYRHLSSGFSRKTNWFGNHQRQLRQFMAHGAMPPAERAALWTALVGFHQELEQLRSRQGLLRYRLADRIHSLVARLPWIVTGLKRLIGRLGGAENRNGRNIRPLRASNPENSPLRSVAAR